jgi:hypothetical protein
MKLLICLTLIITTQLVQATESISMPSPRDQRKIGAYASIGTPFPTLTGLNLAYNLNKDTRVFLGYGETTVATSISINASGAAVSESKVNVIGLGANYFMTDWSFRPTIGATVSQVSFSGEGDMSLNGVNKAGTVLSSQLGFDWQGESGYEVGLGYQLGLNVASSSVYINTGYFF